MSPTVRQPTHLPHLQLVGIQEKGQIRLTWAALTQGVNLAAPGVLTVTDGAFTNHIALTPIAMRERSVVYNPLTGRVKFRLQIGPEFGEAELTATPRLIANNDTEQTNAKVETVADTQETAKEAAHVQTVPPRRFQPQRPDLRRPVAATPVLPPPPLLDAVNPSLSVPRLPHVGTDVAPPVEATYVGPNIEKRIFPTLPLNIRRVLLSPIVIHVTVQIDTGGSVAHAASQDGGSSLSNYLVELSKQAALRWHFTPARRDGVPVVSETVLEFRFSPT